MKSLITLGAMFLAFAATTAPRNYQYKDISAKAARPFPEKVQKEHRQPAGSHTLKKVPDARKIR